MRKKILFEKAIEDMYGEIKKITIFYNTKKHKFSSTISVEKKVISGLNNINIDSMLKYCYDNNIETIIGEEE